MKDFTTSHELTSKINQLIQSLPTSPSEGLDTWHIEALCLLVDALVEIKELESYILQADASIAEINDKVVEANEIAKALIDDKNNSIG